MRFAQSLMVSFVALFLAAEVPAHEEHQHPAGNL